MPTSLEQAVTQHQQGQLHEAKEAYERLLEETPDNADIMQLYGLCLCQLQAPTEGLDKIKEAVLLSPAHEIAWANLATISLSLERFEDAYLAANECLALNATNAQALPVKRYFEKVLNPEKFVAAAEILLSDNQPLEAMKLIKINLSLGSPDAASKKEAARILSEHADSLQRNLNFGLIIELYNLSLKCNDEERDYAIKIADLLVHFHYFEQAIRILEKELDTDPNNKELRQKYEHAIKYAKPPSYLQESYKDPSSGYTFKRYRPRESLSYVYIVEVMGTCNLKCPSCPVGNFTHAKKPKGHMHFDLYTKIIDKIRQESPADTPEIWLFNWGEPTLHPKLPEMIQYAKSKNMQTMISSNLNVKQNDHLRNIIAAEPDSFKISLSGFNKETYDLTHAGGDIDLVKENLKHLRTYINETGSSTKVWVGHHIYKHNAHEKDEVRRFCEALNFKHSPINAFLQPVEKLVAIRDGKITEEDREMLALLAIDPFADCDSNAKQAKKGYDCHLRFNMTNIDQNGTVDLCCSIYDKENSLGVNFLELSHAEIEAKKYEHDFCKTCMQKGFASVPPFYEGELP